ncbi:hypothetical protein OPIT5_03610 [Opitutaceae bacterium TAV5]|nr:hypothetical protein OPIT5_03610 [Opitutaceae bacterium TAV5]
MRLRPMIIHPTAIGLETFFETASAADSEFLLGRRSRPLLQRRCSGELADLTRRTRLKIEARSHGMM